MTMGCLRWILTCEVSRSGLAARNNAAVPSQEEYKFWWGYAIVLGAIILLWLSKEVIDVFRVLAANRKVGPDGFTVRQRLFHRAKLSQLVWYLRRRRLAAW